MPVRFFLTGVFVAATLLAAPNAEAAKKWRTKEDCTLIVNPANDGDSFHVRIGRRHYIIRLLWVDTPEAENTYPDRVAEQAKYFGISVQDTIKVGKEAAKFTRDFLSRQPFTVYTQFADARGASKRDRDYGIVKSGDTFLMEALVSNGLARIHGLQAMPPEGPSETIMRMRLKGLENDAKKNRRGGWGYSDAGLSRFELMNRATEVSKQDTTLSRSVAVYSPEDSSRLLGTLRPGTTVTILGSEGYGMARIRFTLPDGRTIEGLARTSDLGL
ncbi:MAG: thermonuclease family protein [Kiritimatiellae bacterium]|nr:thermonuclease family protein [Kiritimatiellia bacterium]